MMPFLTEKRQVIVRVSRCARQAHGCDKSPGADAYVDAAYLFDHWPDVFRHGHLGVCRSGGGPTALALWKASPSPAGGETEHEVPGLEAQGPSKAV
ncbi:MAG: hypothetical protein IPK16_10700 [Anaerolineales bacterium]|nr:hypothetical protein [Anaerolineales bacterium]